VPGVNSHSSFAWPATMVGSLEEFVSRLACFGLRKELIFRGQADSRWSLEPSIDRGIDSNRQYDDRLREEAELIAGFCAKSERFLGPLERRYVAGMRKDDKVIRMTVMQHFGAPTRLLDWTSSAAVAAYFACIDPRPAEGTIWWIDATKLEQALHESWEDLGFSRQKDGTINYNDRVFDPGVVPFVGLVYLPIPFARAQAQLGLFTLGSRLGILHDEVLPVLLPSSAYGRVNIPPGLKGSVIDYLARAGINAASLQHAGADRCGLEMSWERRHNNGTQEVQ